MNRQKEDDNQDSLAASQTVLTFVQNSDLQLLKEAQTALVTVNLQ